MKGIRNIAIIVVLLAMGASTLRYFRAQSSPKRESHNDDGWRLELAERAWEMAKNGRIEEARNDFAKACRGTTDLRVLDFAIQFYHQTGDLDEEEALLERWLDDNNRETETFGTAGAFAKLGIIFLTRGEFDRAEETLRKSLTIFEKLGIEQDTIPIYSSLAEIHQLRGERNRAKEMLQKALSLSENLGDQAGIAAVCNSFGVFYRQQDELDQAEKMLQKALAIHAKLEDQHGLANGYANLSVVFHARGELDRAEEVLQKSLVLHEKLGSEDGIARATGGLGSLAAQQGDFVRARQLWTSARDLFAKVGIPQEKMRYQEFLDQLPKR